MNKSWHENNPMPKNATIKQKAKWHLAHTKQCGCRPIPKSVQIFIDENKKQKSRV